MNISRINYLRHQLELEEISLDEVLEIDTAFKTLADSGVELRDDPENALASDMLDELEEHCGTVEKAIYEWIVTNFGESEANEPAYDIGLLAKKINNINVISGAENSKLGILLGEM